jgi:CheY-like chemotaxis protein
VKVDPGQVEQVVMNLVVNARDAMPDGGTLTLETAAIELDEVSARLHDDAVPGRYVVLSVSDTGSGMDAETQAKVFEPFFTTKPQGKGTGLGLSTVYGIVKQSGGHIWVYSEIGHGTTFRICLPLAESPVAEDEASLAPAPIAQGAETILLVEDAPRVREVVREILLMGGYTVLEAQHGPDAIEIADRHKGPIHLMLTDVVMPHMSGRELAQRLTPLRPDMKVIYMSGYTDDAIVRHGILHSSTAFLSKPFTPDALAAKVREVLDAAEAGVAAGGPPPAPALDPARNASRNGG